MAPRGGMLQQRVGGLFIAGFEVSEEADAVAVELVVQSVATGADAADTLFVAIGCEAFELRVLKEWVLVRFELPGFGDRHRRHVIRIAAVEGALQI